MRSPVRIQDAYGIFSTAFSCLEPQAVGIFGGILERMERQELAIDLPPQQRVRRDSLNLTEHNLSLIG